MDDRACYEYHVFRMKRNLHLRYTCSAATHGNPMDKLRIMQMTRCPMNENHAVFTPLSRLRHGLRIFTKKRQNCQVRVLHMRRAFYLALLLTGNLFFLRKYKFEKAIVFINTARHNKVYIAHLWNGLNSPRNFILSEFIFKFYYI